MASRSTGGASLVPPKKKKTGREQHRATKTAQARTPNLSRFYRFKQPPIVPGDFTFELDLLRPKLPALSLDHMVDTLGWNDEQSGLTGTVTAYRPDPADPRTLPVTRGHLIRCRVKWAGGTYQLWTMRVGAVAAELDTGNVSIPLADDMALIDGHGRDWWFRKTKHRPFGYTAHEIAATVASRCGVKLRAAAQGTTRMEIKMRNASGLAVLKAAYQKEKAKSGRTFVIRLRDGELEIVPLTRNTMIYVLASQIQTALITEKGGQNVPTTVLEGRGRIGQGKHTRKLTYTAHDQAVVRLLGYVHDTKDFGRVTSHSELRDLTKRELATRLRLNDTAEITHPGIPFILRGDGAQLDLPSEGYKAQDSFVWCTRATHTVQAGTYQTQFDFNAVDPYLGSTGKATSAHPKAKAKRTAAKRAAKRLVRPRPKLKKKR